MQKIIILCIILFISCSSRDEYIEEGVYYSNGFFIIARKDSLININVGSQAKIGKSISLKERNKLVYRSSENRNPISKIVKLDSLTIKLISFDSILIERGDLLYSYRKLRINDILWDSIQICRKKSYDYRCHTIYYQDIILQSQQNRPLTLGEELRILTDPEISFKAYNSNKSFYDITVYFKMGWPLKKSVQIPDIMVNLEQYLSENIKVKPSVLSIE